MTLIQKLRNFIVWLRLSAADKRAIRRVHNPYPVEDVMKVASIRAQLADRGWSDAEIDAAIGVPKPSSAERVETLGRLWTL